MQFILSKWTYYRLSSNFYSYELVAENSESKHNNRKERMTREIGVSIDTNRINSLNKPSTEITQPSSIAEMLLGHPF